MFGNRCNQLKLNDFKPLQPGRTSTHLVHMALSSPTRGTACGRGLGRRLPRVVAQRLPTFSTPIEGSGRVTRHSEIGGFCRGPNRHWQTPLWLRLPDRECRVSNCLSSHRPAAEPLTIFAGGLERFPGGLRKQFRHGIVRLDPGIENHPAVLDTNPHLRPSLEVYQTQDLLGACQGAVLRYRSVVFNTIASRAPAFSSCSRISGSAFFSYAAPIGTGVPAATFGSRP